MPGTKLGAWGTVIELGFMRQQRPKRDTVCVARVKTKFKNLLSFARREFLN